MSRIKTFSNGGTVLPSDLDAMEDDYEVAFGAYKDALYVGNVGFSNGDSGAAVLGLPGNSLASTATVPTNGAWGLLYLDPALWWSDASTNTVNPRTVYYNLSVWGSANNVATGVNYTVGLYPVTGVGSGTYPQLALGTVVSGSTVTFNTPAAGALFSKYSGDLTAPAAGMYAVAATPSTTVGGTSSAVTISARLLVRQV